MATRLQLEPERLLFALDATGIGSVEQYARDAGYRWILGVDEAGRGPLAGPVTTAAVVLDLHQLGWCEGLNDSKKLSARRREELSLVVFERAIAASVHHVPVEEVDRLNVLGASLWGMEHCARKVSEALGGGFEQILVVVDGKQRLLHYDGPQQALIKGDARSYAIAAASILAKVARDRWMLELHQKHPDYGFDRHKGYPTAAHLRALKTHGPLDCHRRSFAPVAATIAEWKR